MCESKSASLSNLILVKKHVWNSIFDLVDAFTVRALEFTLSDLSFDKQQVHLLDELLLIKHLFFVFFWQGDTPLELKYSIHVNAPDYSSMRTLLTEATVSRRAPHSSFSASLLTSGVVQAMAVSSS